MARLLRRLAAATALSSACIPSFVGAQAPSHGTIAPSSSVAELEAQLPALTGVGRARVLAKLTNALEIDRPAKAVAYGTEALRLFATYPDSAAEVVTRNELAWAYMTLSRYDSAVASAESGLALARRTGQRAGEARALSNLGSIAQRRGEPDSAVALFERALVIQRALGLAPETANSLNNLGFVYSTDLAEYDRSLEYHLEALRLRETLGDSGAIALSLNNLGIVYDHLRRHDLALDFFNRALAIRRALGAQARVAATLDNIGSLHLQRGHVRQALDAHQESLAIRSTLKDRSAVSLAHRNVGMVYLAMGRRADARRELQEALRIGDSVGDKGLSVRNQLTLASLERTSGRLAAAESAVERALAIAREMNSRDLQMRAWEELSNVQAAAGRERDALESYRRFKAMSDSIFDAGTSHRISSLERRAATERRQHEATLVTQRETMLRLEATQRAVQRDAIAGAAVLLGLFGLLAYRRRVERTRLAEAMSLTDSLTGVNNRRYFQQVIALDVPSSVRLHEAAARRGVEAVDADLIVLLLDIDHFKQINDAHGHAAGDRLLVELAGVLQSESRDSDVLVRWGGEEFLVLGRFADRRQAPAYAERIRRAVESHTTTLDNGRVLRVTCSIGFSVFPFDAAAPSAVGWEQIVSLADHGAYTAKRMGRNRSVGYVAGHGGLPAGAVHATAADLQAWIASGRLRRVLGAGSDGDGLVAAV